MPKYEWQQPLTLEKVHQILSTHPDFSDRRVSLAVATVTLSPEKHGDRTMMFDRAAGVVVTMPKATGSGLRYKFMVKTAATSNTLAVKVGNAVDIFQGLIMALSDGSNAVLGWATAADSDTITFDRTTTGTATVGQWIELEDVAVGVYAVKGQIAQSGSEATPFSAAV